MDNIREAFQKVKQDITSLKQEIDFLTLNLTEIKQEIIQINNLIESSLVKKTLQKSPTQDPLFSTPSTHPSTHSTSLEGLKSQNIPFSTGNEGVPTDKQTNRQTDRQTPKEVKNKEDSIDSAVEILDSLDNIKKEIRLKFKRLTEQEFLVFSTLYQLVEELGYSNYKIISNKLNLTESSIRDYIGRLIKKGIPVEKNKINNKNIQLSISQNFKKIASLSTILQLRDL